MSYRRRLSSLSAGRGRCATFAKEHHLELGLWRRCRLRGGSHEKLEEWAAEVPLEALMGLEGIARPAPIGGARVPLVASRV